MDYNKDDEGRYSRWDYSGHRGCVLSALAIIVGIIA